MTDVTGVGIRNLLAGNLRKSAGIMRFGNGLPRQSVPQGHLLRGADWLAMTGVRFIETLKQGSLRLPCSDCQKTCPVTSIGGKDSVKGNRQGSLSRSITRRSDQNRKIKYCFLFCDFASACQKSPNGLF